MSARVAAPARVAGGLFAFILDIGVALFKRDGEPPMTRFLAEQLSTPHWYDISAAQRDFGYTPKVGTADGLQRLAAWWRTRA